MGFFDTLLSPIRGIENALFPNPADAAKKYLTGIPDELKKYFQPYVSAGQGAMGTLQGQYGNLLNDPGALMAKIGAGFRESPGYQYDLTQGLNAGNMAAAAGGMAGTPASIESASRFATGLSDKYYNDYLTKALGLYGEGLEGEQGLNEMGFEASTGLGEDIAGNMGNLANLTYQGQAGQNQNLSSIISNLLRAHSGGSMGGSAGAGGV